MIGCALATLAADPTIAQDDAAPPELEAAAALSGEPRLEWKALAGVWMPRLGGESTLGTVSGPIDIETQLGLNDSESFFRGELELRKAEIWELHLDLFDFSTSTSGIFTGTETFGGVSLSPGDPFSSSATLTSFAAELNVGVYRPFRLNPEEHGVDLRFSPQFGFRWIDLEHTLTETGGASATAGSEWAAPYGGIHAEMVWDAKPFPLVELLELEAGVSGGPVLGGEGGFIWQVRGGITVMFTDSVGLMVGYRLLEMSVENDDFLFEGGLQGLYVGGSVTF